MKCQILFTGKISKKTTNKKTQQTTKTKKTNNNNNNKKQQQQQNYHQLSFVELTQRVVKVKLYSLGDVMHKFFYLHCFVS